MANRREQRIELLKNVVSKVDAIDDIMGEVDDHWASVDAFYRFYHHSFKAYRVQGLTQFIVDFFTSLAPEGVELNSTFLKIVEEGTGKKFEMNHNKEWDKIVRPQFEAFFHAHKFLEMALSTAIDKETKRLIEGENVALASHTAAFLYLYNLRS